MAEQLVFNQLSRREYLGVLAGTAAAMTLSPVESARGFWANDRLEVACIGTGGRCRHLMERLARIPGVRMGAVCDVWDARRAEAKKLADPAATEELDFRRILERDDVDAVVIASPDHWHAPMTIEACEAGKDVYVEKPLTHKVEEGEKVIQAVRNHRRVVQVGTQQRSMPHLIEARDLVRSGLLGTIHKVHMSWNRNAERWSAEKPDIRPEEVNWKMFLGNAPQQPFDSYRLANWRWFWDFGGGIFTDLMVHWYDTARWMLDLPDARSAVSIGHHLAARGIWETPDTVQTLLDFGDDGPQVHFEGTFVNHHGRAQLVLMGSEATLVCDRGAYELIPQRGRRVAPRKRIDGSNPLRGLDFYEDVDCGFYHLTNWVEAVRSRQDPSCPVEEGVRSADGAHLANQALRRGPQGGD
jgi:predicted dehydrogenase